MSTKGERSSFSSRLGFVLSAAGSAVGLGNIWRFPYLAAKYGGGIFLLVYLLLVLSFGYTMIIAESALGRRTKKSPVGAFSHYGKDWMFRFGGWINAVIPILIILSSAAGSPSISSPISAAKSPHSRAMTISRASSPTVTKRSFGSWYLPLQP